MARKNIKSIGVGVPGIVEGGAFWNGTGHHEELCRNDLGNRLAMQYHIPITLENDMNATAVGFGRSYMKKLSCESPEYLNMAYLYLEKFVHQRRVGCGRPGCPGGAQLCRGTGVDTDE